MSMLKIYDLNEFNTERKIDEYIEVYGNIPISQFSARSWTLNTVVEDDPDSGTFYLAENDEVVWWFGPRDRSGIAGQYDYKWFCFRTEDGKYHKFNMIDIPHSREAMNKILQWIAKGSATDGPVLNLTADEVEFMDI